MQRLLPAEWYLLPFASYAVYTEILRLRLRMTVRAGGKNVTLTINCGASHHHNPLNQGRAVVPQPPPLVLTHHLSP